ncbi:hypothetical protein HS99_0034905 [Kitasatospora aureofaciens]|uniref:Uncharacterized protein n=1 Tax=Kitasatospora aureofaciens TaxID=1894 RepID=A0A1E7N2J8_KITAU|nr:hypothetical protein HS99_0034905 [Kitasatospora aureofaciens]
MSSELIRVPDGVSPDISRTIAPSRSFDLGEAVFRAIDQGASKVHHWPLAPVRPYVATDLASW